MKIFIANTGVGNVYSLLTALRRLGSEAYISLSRDKLEEADGIILPGVGNFESAVKRLEKIREYLIDKVKSGTPLLGICLGYQLLFEESEEGAGRGLSIFKGKVVKLPNTVKVPHMGWNTLEKIRPSPITEGIEEGSYVYFVHSYYPKPAEPIVIAETYYGVWFPSIAGRNGVYGVQFHPERSGNVGFRILSNFLKVIKR